MATGLGTMTRAPRKIEIRGCREGDHDGVFALYGLVFGADALARFRRRWRWQFFENPMNDRISSQMWVADRRGEIVGFLASFPTRMRFGDHETTIFHDCDLLVSPTARRMGVGQGLVRAYDEFPNPLSNALAYAPANGRIRGRVGYRPVHAVPFYYRPLRGRPAVDYAVTSDRAPRVVRVPPLSWAARGAGLLLGAGIAAANRLRRPRLPAGWDVGEIARAGGEFDDLWTRLRPMFPLAAVRDRRFVQWRFLDDPVFRHTLLLARDPAGEPAGYLAFRVTPRRGFVMGRIMDLFCTPGRPDAVDALLAAALARFETVGVHLVSCLGLHPGIRARVARYLYMRPARLDRPAWMLWKGDPALADLVYDARRWHLSHADSDIGFSP